MPAADAIVIAPTVTVVGVSSSTATKRALNRLLSRNRANAAVPRPRPAACRARSHRHRTLVAASMTTKASTKAAPATRPAEVPLRRPLRSHQHGAQGEQRETPRSPWRCRRSVPSASGRQATASPHMCVEPDRPDGRDPSARRVRRGSAARTRGTRSMRPTAAAPPAAHRTERRSSANQAAAPPAQPAMHDRRGRIDREGVADALRPADRAGRSRGRPQRCLAGKRNAIGRKASAPSRSTNVAQREGGAAQRQHTASPSKPIARASAVTAPAAQPAQRRRSDHAVAATASTASAICTL